MTISDFVADRRASTPSNAAEIAVPDQIELLRSLQNSRDRLVQAELQMLEMANQKISSLQSRRAMTDPSYALQDRRQRLDHMQDRLTSAARMQLEKNGRRFGQLAAKLDALSPLKVLGRGYALAQSTDGTVLHSSSQVEKGAQIRVRLHEGGLRCTVNEKEE